jgi:hypothetical protein
MNRVLTINAYISFFDILDTSVDTSNPIIKNKNPASHHNEKRGLRPSSAKPSYLVVDYHFYILDIFTKFIDICQR